MRSRSGTRAERRAKTEAIMCMARGGRSFFQRRHPIISPMTSPLFHLAFHFRDLDEARIFYGAVPGCTKGRSTDTCVEINFLSHQISLHLGKPCAGTNTGPRRCRNGADATLRSRDGTRAMRTTAAHFEAADTDFVLQPQVRIESAPGEQWTKFFRDQSRNPIGFKGVRSLASLYDQ